MSEIRKPAVKILQGKRTLFLTSFTVRDFAKANFHRVDKLDVQEATGMQRLLNTSRANKFGKDIIGANEYNEEFLPTSVFLATSGNISYDESTKELFFDDDARAGICPLDVVDGQHRIAGLIEAAKQEDGLWNFPICTVISPNMNEAEKMLQFVTVNTKQQPVNKGVAQHITARFTKMLDVEPLPYIPHWLDKEVKKGADDKSLYIAHFLNSNENSPWFDRIQFADEEKRPGHTITQASFIQSVKSHLLGKGHPLNLNSSVDDKKLRILLNFWQAVSNIFITPSDDGSDAGALSVVFKSIGLEFFHGIFASVHNQLAQNRDYTVSAIENCIRSAENELDTEYVGVMSPEFWQRGSNASSLNRGGTAIYAAAFIDALAKANDSDVQL